jgi:hypothetical protein
MAGLQNTPLRIPDQWDAAWFRQFLVENLAKADVRNAVGVGLTITSDGNSVATLSSDAETAGAITAHNADPFAHADVINAHVADIDPHPQYILPSQSAVADVTGGATVDAEARTAINAVLAHLRTLGLIDP